MIDCKKLPVPKYKVGDRAWILNYDSVKEVEVNCVLIKINWFDNGYTSRQEHFVTYELSGGVFSEYSEKQIYATKRSAQRVLRKNMKKREQEILEDLKQRVINIKERCLQYGLQFDKI